MASPAMAGAVAQPVAEVAAAAPEETAGMGLVVWAAEEVVGRSSMVQTVQTQEAVADTSAVAQAAAKIMAIVPFAPAAEEVEEESLVAASYSFSMEAMEPMAPTAAVAAAAALAHPTTAAAIMRAAVVVMADLAAEVEAQGQSARS